MDDREALLIATVAAVVAVGTVLLTGWGTRSVWAVLLVAVVVFVVLASLTEYAGTRRS